MGWDPAGERVSMDVGEAAVMVADPTPGNPCLVTQDIQRYIEQSTQGNTEEGKLALQALPLLMEGHTRGEIATLLQTTKTALARTLLYLRRIITKLGYAEVTNNWPIVCNF